MNCEEYKDLIVSHALETLNPDERAKVVAHLDSGCAECNAWLREVRSTLDWLPLGLEPVAPPAILRDRLLARVAGRSSVRSGPRPARRILDAAIAGAVAAAVTAGIFLHFTDQRLRAVASLRAELEETRSALDRLRSAVRTDSRRIEMLESPAVRLVSMEGTSAQPRARARVYWDQDRGAWHFHATDLHPLPRDRVYELWLINAGQRKFPGGTFSPDAAGAAGLIADSPPDAGKIVAVAVTDEKAGGVPQPQGTIQMLGRVE